MGPRREPGDVTEEAGARDPHDATEDVDSRDPRDATDEVGSRAEETARDSQHDPREPVDGPNSDEGEPD